jgi:hypothetical protein
MPMSDSIEAVKAAAPRSPLFAGAGTLLAVAVARGMSAGTLPGYRCPMLHWIGIPCPGCGATRCLAACGRLDFAVAIFWNPAAALVACALVGWAALALANARLANQAATRIGGLLTGSRVAALLIINWLYLCWALPR